jgi:protocatechuate 3,4-dioxygenase beta subunit
MNHLDQQSEQHTDHHDDINDLGLTADLNMWVRSPIDRRQALSLGLAGITSLLGGTQLVEAAATCVTKIPRETAGPYPGDGSNGLDRSSSTKLNVLKKSGIVRSDIRTSLTTKNVAAGIPVTLELTLVNTSKKCAPLVGYAIYAWHCDREGNYSMYSNGVTAEDYLRGVQVTDKNGKVTFKTIFPACYPGRWPHVHFEIYATLAKATGSANVVHTSQLAMPESVCNTVFATTGYESSVKNLSQLTLATDNVFRDGSTLQVATVTGDATKGYTATLTVGI